MPRVLHHRVHGLASDRVERLERQFENLASARTWRSAPVWIATDRSTGLFEMEYFRHLREAEGEDLSAGGFLKMAGDETDALILAVFLRDLSAEYGVRAVLRDEDNPISKLRYLEFRRGRLPSGNSLEEILARRPLIKKVMGQAITFYPPTFRPHSQAPERESHTHWGYALCGLRANAASLLEAEQEAMKILRGLRHLGR